MIALEVYKEDVHKLSFYKIKGVVQWLLIFIKSGYLKEIFASVNTFLSYNMVEDLLKSKILILHTDYSSVEQHN